MKRTLSLAIMLLLFGAAAQAQSFHTLLNGRQATSSGKSGKQSGTISGRVTDEAGQPLTSAVIYLYSASSRQHERDTSADEQGRFHISDLGPGSYYVTPHAPGYVTDGEDLSRKIYHPGDAVNFTLTKGGVITGSVLSQTDEPVTTVKVEAVRIKDKDGHPVASSNSTNTATADDRGIYRIYALASGTYIVLASGKGSDSGRESIYKNDVPTYYPSSTRDTAQTIAVQAGQEISNIDIHYRGERGHAVSGRVISSTSDAARKMFSLLLYNLATGGIEDSTAAGYFRSVNNDGGFIFYGVPDGDYLIRAASYSYQDDGKGVSGTARAKVKGADTTGVQITLKPFGAIAGTLMIAPMHTADGQDKCEIKRRLAPDDINLTARRTELEKNNELKFLNNSPPYSVPSEKGEFMLSRIEANSYRVVPDLVGEDYFVQSLTLPAADPKQPPADASRTPLNVKPGETIKGLMLTVAEGAAAVRGRVTPAAAGARLPDRLLVHLVPAEPDAANQVLRYAEANVNADGSFTMTNLAPGHYFIIARPSAEDKASNEFTRPIAWDATERAALYKQATAANSAIDLQPCQHLADYSLKVAPTAKKKPEDSKPQ